jgi:hypothetical protein
VKYVNIYLLTKKEREMHNYWSQYSYSELMSMQGVEIDDEHSEDENDYEPYNFENDEGDIQDDE